jgi:hypothetical protein
MMKNARHPPQIIRITATIAPIAPPDIPPAELSSFESAADDDDGLMAEDDDGNVDV